MHRTLAFVAALTLGLTSVSHASLTGMDYGFYPTGSSEPIGTLSLGSAPALSSVGWVLPYTYDLDPNIASFYFDFSSVGGPVVALGQFDSLCPIAGDPVISLTGAEIDSGMLIGASDLDQGQWEMSDLAGFDQAQWTTNAESTTTILGDWRQLPEPATLTLLAMGGLAILRRRH